MIWFLGGLLRNQNCFSSTKLSESTTMSEKFKGKYRIPSARAYWWYYSSDAAYFVTISTKDRHHYFGEITPRTDAIHRVSSKKDASSNPHMLPTKSGILAANIWLKIPEQFSFCRLGEFVIMPDHMHGILIIEGAPKRDITSLEKKRGGITGMNNPMLHQNLSRIIRWYKGRCTFEIRKFNPEFAWQSRFHDHIIRDNASYDRITTYIQNNIQNWNKDRNHAP